MGVKKSIFKHPRWGTVIITSNPRARRITMRADRNAILMTVPVYATEADIENALEKCGERLLEAQRKKELPVIEQEYSIEAPNFRLAIKEYEGTTIKLTVCNGIYAIHCPIGCDYTSDSVQQTLRNGIKSAMKHRAKIFLPQRLKALADEHGFKYGKCTVRDAHSRWGCCTSEGNISLNVRLIVLPDRLIDYVLLHELCHTVEMNHSDRFWALMDVHTAPARAKRLRAELKAANMPELGL